MKRTSNTVFFVILALVMAVLAMSLSACGSKDADATVGTTPSSVDGVSIADNVPGAGEDTPDEAEPTKTPVAPPADGDLPDNAEKASAADRKAIAAGFIDCVVEDLYQAIGEPVNSEYGPSCLGSGEDGVLHYNGFDVYTYKENGVETVVEVY